MEFEFWWLLALPVFFGMGWVAARVDLKSLLSESRALPSSYFRGLNFLLNEQPDKAIESFIEVVQVDPQTIDLHFALGSLFRRQGETERAIRMHQNLLDRPTLPADKRTMATYELAQDFHRAGLLDRAETLFQRLDETPFEHSALSHLIEIYETEKDWPISRLRGRKSIARSPRIAAVHARIWSPGMLQPRRAICARRSKPGSGSNRRIRHSSRLPPIASRTRSAGFATFPPASGCCATTTNSTRRSICSTRCSR